MAARRTATTPFSHGDGPIDDCLSIRNGALFIEGCDSTKLAARFGTPLYVMSAEQPAPVRGGQIVVMAIAGTGN
jgi:hypothetical protein